jgi:protein O-mannosyl-transferase
VSPGRIDRATRQALGLAALLFVITVWAYFPVVHHPFVNYDDPDYVTDNTRVQQGITGSTVAWAFTTMESANWHPLTWFSHALDCEFFGLHPSGHHATSLFFHALNAVLLFWLLWKATGKLGRSLVVAAFFALHPINVESVAWVAERKSLLCMLFILLTLAAYGWYVRNVTVERYLVVAMCFAFALMAKPMAVTLPFALLLIDIWPLHRLSLRASEPQSAPQRPLLALAVEKLPLFAMTAASCVVTVVAQRRVIKPLQVVPFGARVVNAIYSYVAYIAKAFWPSHLAVFYAQQGSRLAAWQVILCAAVLVTVSVTAWKLRSLSYFLMGWLWFLGTLVPMIGLVQVGDQGMADRYAYLSFLGIFVAVAWGTADLADRFRIDSRVTASVAGAAIMALSFATRAQLQTWESNTALWTRSLEITPDNYIAHDLVGLAISQESFRATGESCPDEALAHFQKAVSLNSGDTLGQLDDGFCELSRKNFQLAIEHYQAALQSTPNKYLKSRAYLNLGGAYQDKGDFAASRESYRHALEIFPQDADVRRDMARLDAREKIAQLSKTVATSPSAEVYVQLGRAQQEAGLMQDARSSYQHALGIDPNFVPAFDGLRSLGVIQ